MTAPSLPRRRVRHRLAEAILDALHDQVARRALARLAGDEMAAREWLGPHEAGQVDAVKARAQRACAMLEGAPLGASAGTLSDALEDAALLFDAGLFFECHELLEPHWRQASGQAREALQGLIQIAVGYQHRADGNALGAHALLGEGVTRVRGRHLGGMSLDEFAEAVAETIGSTAAGAETPRVVPRFPRASARLTSAAATPPP
jgi:predicted metal-dependent hydrolase